jgi:WD40 repeat protein
MCAPGSRQRQESSTGLQGTLETGSRAYLLLIFTFLHQLKDQLEPVFNVICTAQDNFARINSISYHRTEDLLVTASDDDTVQVIDTAMAQKKGSTPSKKYGCSCITWTHSPYSVVYASNKVSTRASPFCFLFYILISAWQVPMETLCRVRGG